MELADYLENEDLTLAQFGRLIANHLGNKPAVEESTVARWRDGVIFPSPDNVSAILQVTDGSVTYADFQRVRDRVKAA